MAAVLQLTDLSTKLELHMYICMYISRCASCLCKSMHWHHELKHSQCDSSGKDITKVWDLFLIIRCLVYLLALYL